MSTTPTRGQGSLSTLEGSQSFSHYSDDNSSSLSPLCFEADDASDACLRPGVGDRSFTSFEEQLKAARQRERLRRKKEMEAKLGGAPLMSLKERLKLFEKGPQPGPAAAP